MSYALWEVAVPLLAAFAVGLGAGWFVWRWRRTAVTSDEWRVLNEQANDGKSALKSKPDSSRQQMADLKALVEVRDIEIAQLRQSIAEHIPDDK